MSDDTIEVDGPDPLKTLHAEIQKQSARIIQLRNPGTNVITQEMAGTVLAIVSDVVIALAQVRDGHDDALVDLDDRLTAIEDDESKLTAEDADKLSALVDTVKHLVEVIRGSGQQSADVEQALGLADELATECAELIDDARMEDDEDEDEDEAPVPQIGNA